MNAFAPKSVAAQKVEFARNVRRRLSNTKRHLADMYSREIERAHQYHERSNDLRCKIGLVHDRIANAADKEFGGWSIWRHTDSLLKEVSGRMAEQTKDIEARADACVEQANQVLAKYHAELKKAEAEASRLLRTL